MNKYLRWTFAAAYIIVTLLLLTGVVKHSAWFLAGLEPPQDQGFGWVLAAALDGALVVSTCTLVSYQLRHSAPPPIVGRAFWLFLLYSTVANLAHALAHNHLSDWSQGVTWWYYFSSLVGAALLPTALAIMPHAAEAVLAEDVPQQLPQPTPPFEAKVAANLLQELPHHEPQQAAEVAAELPLAEPQPSPQLAGVFAAAEAANLPQQVTQEVPQPSRSTSRNQTATLRQTEPRTVAEIAAALQLSSDTVRRKLAALEAAGKAQKIDSRPARYIVRNTQIKGAL